MKTIALFIVALLFSTTAFAQEPYEVWVKSIKGVAYAKKNAKLALVQNMPIVKGTTIYTGKNGFVVLRFSDGSNVKIAPKTAFQVGYLKKDKSNVRWLMRLATGWVRAFVNSEGRKKNKKIKFKINTPSGTIGVRGTDFFAFANESGEGTVVRVIEGRVLVARRNTFFENDKSYVVSRMKSKGAWVSKVEAVPSADVTAGKIGVVKKLREKPVVVDQKSAIERTKDFKEYFVNVDEEAKREFMAKAKADTPVKRMDKVMVEALHADQLGAVKTLVEGTPAEKEYAKEVVENIAKQRNTTTAELEKQFADARPGEPSKLNFLEKMKERGEDRRVRREDRRKKREERRKKRQDRREKHDFRDDRKSDWDNSSYENWKQEFQKEQATATGGGTSEKNDIVDAIKNMEEEMKKIEEKAKDFIESEEEKRAPCSGNKVRRYDGPCECPDGLKEAANGRCYEPCSDGKVFDYDGDCVYPKKDNDDEDEDDGGDAYKDDDKKKSSSNSNKKSMGAGH